jgi:hypothetical protein
VAYYQRRALDTPPNSPLDTEFSKIKKYPFVFHALKSFLCIYKTSNWNSTEFSIDIIIIYRGKIAKHDSVHIIFCRLRQEKFSCLLVFNSLLQILKFSDPYQFFATIFRVPCPKKEQKILLRPCFGAFLTLGPCVICIPCWNREQKNHLGPALWDLDF